MFNYKKCIVLGGYMWMDISILERTASYRNYGLPRFMPSELEVGNLAMFTLFNVLGLDYSVLPE